MNIEYVNVSLFERIYKKITLRIFFWDRCSYINNILTLFFKKALKQLINKFLQKQRHLSLLNVLTYTQIPTNTDVYV